MSENRHRLERDAIGFDGSSPRSESAIAVSAARSRYCLTRPVPLLLLRTRKGRSKMRKLLVAPAVALLLTALVTPLNAITGNWVEDFEHPFVGLAVFYDVNGEFLWRCSGTLLSPTVFLTAGHCADAVSGAVSARVYFQQDAGANYDPATQLETQSPDIRRLAPPVHRESLAQRRIGSTTSTSRDV